MAPFDIYDFLLVDHCSIAVCCTIFKLFDVE